MSKQEEPKDPDREAPGPRSFATQMATICDGELNASASRELNDALLYLESENQARRAKVKGKFKLEIDLIVDDGVCLFSYSIKSKLPEPRRQAAVMWLDKAGNLVAENPRQIKLPLREVPRGAAARDVNDAKTPKEA